MRKSDRAFPIQAPIHSWGDPDGGLTVRDYIAIKAMNGLVTRIQDTDTVVSLSYLIADKMIEISEENNA